MKFDNVAYCLFGLNNEERVQLFEFVADFEKNHNAGVCGCVFSVGNYSFKIDLCKKLVSRI